MYVCTSRRLRVYSLQAGNKNPRMTKRVDEIKPEGPKLQRTYLQLERLPINDLQVGNTNEHYIPHRHERLDKIKLQGTEPQRTYLLQDAYGNNVLNST